jgi:DNA topoisomerase VI subunit B
MNSLAENGTGSSPVAAAEGFHRETFSVSRMMEFFSEEELRTQIGHAPPLWPLALLKELTDNSLDACEIAGTRPSVVVTVEPDAVVVADTGDGLPVEVIKQSLDYGVRVSDKLHYVSPTRGQQGNALKTVWAAPFVYATTVYGNLCRPGARANPAGRVEVVTGGQRHVIEVTLDRINQEPRLRHTPLAEEGSVKTGTLIRVNWPKAACYLATPPKGDFYRGDDFYNADRLLRAYSTFNPHATFSLETPDTELDYLPTNESWVKWQPDQATSPHWYSTERLRGLIAAYIAKERAGGKPLKVRDFLAKFDGLSSTQKRPKVLRAAGLTDAWLSDLADGDDVDVEAVGRLLAAMQAAARPVKPKALGVLGAEHLVENLAFEWFCTRGSVRYKRATGFAGGLPFVLEVAVGVQRRDDENGRQIVAGVNWSPAIESPFEELPYLIGKMRVDEDDPVTVVAHLAYPRPEFTDRGKGHLDLPDEVAEALEKCVQSVAKGWKEAKRSSDREDRLHQQQLDRLRKAERSKELSLIDAAYSVMEEAYLQASGDNADPANARQVMYAARRQILKLTGGKSWSHASYFTQKLLPDFVEANPELTADWDVVFDARGHLTEPHTGQSIGLGTLEVRDYINGWTVSIPDRAMDVSLSADVPTYGPVNRYRYVLFVEKEGFYPLLERHRIADRYDVAIMSTKGMSVTAARQVVDRLSEQGVTILVLRDFDKSGFSIVHTLRTDSRRYKFRTRPNVIDLGLRLADVRAWGLDELSEPVPYESKKDPRLVLRARGATEEECAFLVDEPAPGRGWSGKRVELNAFTSPRFIEFIEHKFAEVGVAKVVPSADALAAAYRRAVETDRLNRRLREIRDAVHDEAQRVEIPEGLAETIRRRLEGQQELSWDAVVAELAAEDPGRGEAA